MLEKVRNFDSYSEPYFIRTLMESNDRTIFKILCQPIKNWVRCLILKFIAVTVLNFNSWIFLIGAKNIIDDLFNLKSFCLYYEANMGRGKKLGIL